MEEFSEQLYSELKNSLDQNSNSTETGSTLQRKGNVEIAFNYLNRLKDEALKYDFQSPEEEIKFFKKIKPKFSSVLIFYSTIERIELDKPEGGLAHVKGFYDGELKGIKRFFESNKQIYAYYRSEDTYLDWQLFLRGVSDTPRWLCKMRIDHDERFCTAGDYIFGRIMATEQVARYLESAISGLEFHPFIGDEIPTTWTGESINLLELAYGVFCTGQINQGKIGLGELVRKFEKVFNVNLGRPYRRFSEIKQRKRLSRTKYLDDMAKSINKKIDDEDAYVPEHQKL